MPPVLLMITAATGAAVFLGVVLSSGLLESVVEVPVVPPSAVDVGDEVVGVVEVVAVGVTASGAGVAVGVDDGATTGAGVTMLVMVVVMVVTTA